MSEQLVVYETPNKDKITLSPEIVKQRLVRGNGKITDQEALFFLAMCKANRLNPFNNEAYLIKFGNEPATQVTSYHVFMARADRQEQYDGFEAGLYLKGADGKVEERVGSFYLPEETILGAWCKVYRKDREHPFIRAVSFGEYERKKNDGTPMRNWSKDGMPGTMIIKVPIGQAHRDAFPNVFSNMFLEEEVASNEKTSFVDIPEPKAVIDAEVVEEQVAELVEKPKRGRPPKEKEPDGELFEVNEEEELVIKIKELCTALGKEEPKFPTDLEELNKLRLSLVREYNEKFNK